MAKWFVNRNGKQIGPFESAQLKKFASEGKIKPDDQIRRDDQEKWHKAESVKGLLVVSNQVTSSAASVPPPLPKPYGGPPPKPSGANEDQKLPWYHPASLVAYAIVASMILMFSQARLASSRRTKAPQATNEVQQDRTAVASKSKPPNATSELGSRKADPKPNVGLLKEKFIKINTDKNAPVLTRDFLPETNEHRTYSFVSRGEKGIYLKRTVTGVPSCVDSTVSGGNSLISALPIGYITRLYLGAAPGDKWYIGDSIEYEFKGFADKEGNVSLSQLQDYAKITERDLDDRRREYDFLYQRGVGIVAVDQYLLENGKRQSYSCISSRMIGR